MTHDETREDLLLARLMEGDQAALAQLYSVHRDRLKQMLSHRIDRRLRQRVDLSDVLQDVYIDALKRLRHFTSMQEQSFYVWLRQIAMQRLIDLHRRHLLAGKRAASAELPLVGNNFNASASHDWAVQLVGSQVSASKVVVQQELIARVENVLDRMDVVDREVLALRHFEEMSNSEIAEALGLSPAAASNRYVRALSRLREALAGESDLFAE
ncbi:MAG: sigma-70 family RNA polymerase sigma factor [Planctomycetales bacterium]|nr:sigma-70 family RNA polymerase sigma factor [Planctomycetaceae bacterium]MCA9128231.1 sigma-70 family RNA polymerase sigma factor [Planctomycetales bacterium]